LRTKTLPRSLPIEDRGDGHSSGVARQSQKDKDMTTVEKLRHISSQEFALLGMQGIAYVRRAVVNGAVVYAIHAADGTQVALVPSYDVAVATVRQHDLEPLSVH
jgi:hypothetical protein